MGFDDRFRSTNKSGEQGRFDLRNTVTQRPQNTLRKKARHAGIFEAVRALDTQLDEATRRELARWIGDQYRVEYGSVLLGMVAVCYLGPPYVDHRLDLLGGIVEHYAAADPMPGLYDSARMLARTGSYAFVEVHSNGDLVPVADDGTVR